MYRFEFVFFSSDRFVLNTLLRGELAGAAHLLILIALVSKGALDAYTNRGKSLLNFFYIFMTSAVRESICNVVLSSTYLHPHSPCGTYAVFPSFHRVTSVLSVCVTVIQRSEHQCSNSSFLSVSPRAGQQPFRLKPLFFFFLQTSIRAPPRSTG